MSSFIVRPGGSFKGSIRVPGDKSISHRSVILGSLANGRTEVSGFLEGQDSLNTLKAFRSMGVPIEYTPSTDDSGGALLIDGVGLHGLQAPSQALDFGNSGTAMRLMAGVMAAQSFSCELIGDESLHSRPMGRVMEPLNSMGANIAGTADSRPPLVVTGDCSLKGIDYSTPVASAQIKSCLLLAGLYADGVTQITEPGVSRDHTERMFRGFGVEIETGNLRVSLRGGQTLQGTEVVVPADISSAAFFIVGACISPGSDVRLFNVGMNPTRTGVLDILRLMGADIEVHNQREIAGEPVADLRVCYSPLSGIDVPAELVPLAIDEFPAIFVAAACAEGQTTITGAEELRVKETDRITAMVEGLTTLGATIRETPDGAVIDGGAQLGGGHVKSYHDHRIAMSLAIAGLVSSAEIHIADCDNVATSFPNFTQLAQSSGLDITLVTK